MANELNYAKQTQFAGYSNERNIGPYNQLPITSNQLPICKTNPIKANQTQFQRRAADEEFNKKGRKRIAYGLSVHNQNVSHYKGLYPPRIMADLSMYQGGCRI